MAVRGKKDSEQERLASADSGEQERPAPKEAEEEGPLGGLVTGLEEIVPGLVVLDRALAFEGGARADLAGVDPSGRLHLVLLAGEDPDRAALEALDGLAVLREELELVVRHLGEGRVNTELGPRLLLVSPSCDERLAQRLSALADAGVQVLGLRTLKSAAGERTYVVRLAAPAPESGAGGVAAFRRALPARLETLVATLIERMGRLDEELALRGDATTLVWRLSGEVLCRVERIGDLLQASVAPRHDPMLLAEPPDLEALVERALGQLVRVLGLSRGERPTGPRRPGGEEPILTPEEIQAFRE